MDDVRRPLYLQLRKDGKCRFRAPVPDDLVDAFGKKNETKSLGTTDAKDEIMNKLLEKAFAEAASRPDDEQALIASIVLEELHDEALWQQKFARDADKLDAIAAKVRGQIARGETSPFDPSDAPHE
ncbi:MAG: hypothetical protein HZA67_02690 [Rhodospirillales bacterium]|nr:hypothetical protein [Rhodospirillales bacterium]